MTIVLRNQVKCRSIQAADLTGVAERLAQEFPTRSRDFWRAGLERLGQLPTIGDLPKYGHLVESEGRIVGVLLQIFFRRGEGEQAPIYCNLSSWCLDPKFRGYAPMLNSAATARKDVTYLNISPAPHTRPSIEALGFRRYCDGQYICAPALSATRYPDVKIVNYAPQSPEAALLSSSEREVLSAHVALGCRALIAVSKDGARPFVFLKRKIARRLVPCAQLIFCRDIADFEACAGALGRHLIGRGVFLCLLDSNGPPPGLVGRYMPGSGPKYFKGPAAPRLGDLSFTELPVFQL